MAGYHQRRVLPHHGRTCGRESGRARHDGENLAYLIRLPRTSGMSELAVIVHGPASRELTGRAAGQLRAWANDRPVITAWPGGVPEFVQSI